MANVLMIAPQPFFRARGTPFSILHRIRALLAGGHRVHLVTYPFGEDVEMPGLQITRCGGVPGVRDVHLGPSIGKLLLDLKLVTATAMVLRSGDFDVLHSHEEAAFFCRYFARRAGIPHIYDMHSSLPQQLGNFSRYNRAPVRRLFKCLETGVLESADGVITICDELAGMAQPYVSQRPHAMIENTGDDRKVFETAASPPAAVASLAGKAVILYTGTLEHYQGVDLLLAAFQRVAAANDDVHLLVVGGRPDQVAAYRERAGMLGVTSRVTFTGLVHPREIPDCIDAASLIVSPRCRGTNTPLKIYGYMRSGKPIVATNLLTHTQTLDGATAVLVPPTVDGLAAGIKRVLEQPDEAARLGQAARERAAARYSDEDYVAKVNALLAAVLDARRSVVVGGSAGRPTDGPVTAEFNR